MAGLSWFELDVDMPDDPKCESLGVRLKNPLAFGYVVRLYAYCYRHETDTFVGLGAPGTIENACRWRGKTGALLAALMAEGFVDHVPAATYTVHGVGKRLSSAMKRRDDASDRKRRWRETHAGQDADGTRDGTRDETVTHNRPNLTRPNPTKTDNGIDPVSGTDDLPAPGLRPARIGPGCVEWQAWEHWRAVAWPRLSSEPCLAATQRDASKLRDLCKTPGIEAVKAAMDRAVADPWWSQPGKLDLPSFLLNFGKFTQRNEAPSRPVKVLA